jgi:hypothetical protein
MEKRKSCAANFIGLNTTHSWHYFFYFIVTFLMNLISLASYGTPLGRKMS